ncbi:unnamed protein product, partial [Meganyctiphanes norvegica]
MLRYIGAAKVLKKDGNAQVDNGVFHLHYRVTVIIFFIASQLVTAKEFFGKPIQCMSKTIPSGILNNYCYIMSTFSIPRQLNKGDAAAYAGLGTHIDDEELTYHAYYQWVPFMLFFQAITFFLPRYLWKLWDGGVFDTVLGGLHKFLPQHGMRIKKHKMLAQYLSKSLHLHKLWTIKFFICEVLCLVISVGNMYFTDVFLGGTFLNYGLDVMSFPEADPETRVDPMIRIFPKVSKCTFRKYGPSGSQENHDVMCILSINIINEKIYILLWFWLVFLTITTGFWLMYRLAVIFSMRLRKELLYRRGRMAGTKNLDIVIRRCHLGDWFLVYQLGCYMEPMVFAEFIEEFAKELEKGLETLERKPN